MKALEIKKGLILKEGGRLINRQDNTLAIILVTKIKYGATVTEILSNKETSFQIDIQKINNPELWNDMKDISIADLMSFILVNKDFKCLQEDDTGSIQNEKEFKYLEPFYSTLFTYLKDFTNIKIIDI